MKTVVLTMLALIAFAGNSILCRLALGDNAIDATSFTAIRLISGIVVLFVILFITKSNVKDDATKGSWKASLMLFIYAITFSYAYISLETGVGALILFGSVQITMILTGIFLGNRLHKIEWLGVITAFVGFVYLVMPGVSAPPLLGFILMAIAGISWGFYTLAGKGSVNPLSDTAYNFLRTLPFLILILALTFEHTSLTNKGVMLAIASGGLTSGIGYTIWYAALKHITVIQAAVVQLLVPVLATLAGIIFAREILSLHFIISSIMILGGVLAVILGKHYFVNKQT